MKISELDDFQKDSLRQHFFTQTNFSSAEIAYFYQSFNKMIIVGNSSAIFIVAAYFGALLNNGASTDGLVLAILMFLTGLAFAAYSVWYSLAVLGSAFSQNIEQYNKVLFDQMDIESVKLFGFNEAGHKRVRRCHAASLISMIVGFLLVLKKIAGISFTQTFMNLVSI